MTRNNRTFDLILWGATGFTGKLVARYLAGQYTPADLSWAIAGRNRQCLTSLQEDISETYEAWERVPICIADARRPDQLNSMVKETKVLCSTVGPYAIRGTPVVKACVGQNTDYCDLTGEVPWMRRIIDRFHESARAQGTRIVHSCGFDAIPSDIGTLMVQRKAQEVYGSPCHTIRGFVEAKGAKVSGGTAASMLRLVEEASGDRRLQRLLDSPYGLVPNKTHTTDETVRFSCPGYDHWIQQWTIPAIMERLDRSVVHRSNALLNLTPNQSFTFSERMPCGSGFDGAVAASMASIAMTGLEHMLNVSSFRAFLKRFVLPAPGTGPTRSEIENGCFRMTIIGEGNRGDAGGAFHVKGTITSNRDPGYGSTARLFGEAAISLLEDRHEDVRNGGVLTPASAIGTSVIDRLQGGGMSWSVTTGDGYRKKRGE